MSNLEVFPGLTPDEEACDFSKDTPELRVMAQVAEAWKGRAEAAEAEVATLREQLKAAEDVCHVILDTIVRFTGVRQ